jgi:hypothetical protein
MSIEHSASQEEFERTYRDEYGDGSAPTGLGRWHTDPAYKQAIILDIRNRASDANLQAIIDGPVDMKSRMRKKADDRTAADREVIGMAQAAKTELKRRATKGSSAGKLAAEADELDNIADMKEELARMNSDALERGHPNATAEDTAKAIAAAAEARARATKAREMADKAREAAVAAPGAGAAAGSGKRGGKSKSHRNRKSKSNKSKKGKTSKSRRH